MNKIKFESNNYDLTKLLTKPQYALLKIESEMQHQYSTKHLSRQQQDKHEIRNLNDTAELLKFLQLLKNVSNSRGFGRGQ